MNIVTNPRAFSRFQIDNKHYFKKYIRVLNIIFYYSRETSIYCCEFIIVCQKYFGKPNGKNFLMLI
jgi:hypothetical protein